MSVARRASAAAVAAALALGAGACGGDDDQGATSTTGSAAKAASVSPAAAIRAVRSGSAEKPAAKPNVLGGNQDVGRIIQRLTTDAHLYFADTLAAAGVKQLSEPRLATSSGAIASCDGQPVTGQEAPRWCETEQTILAPVDGAEALRTAQGPAPLYVLVAWAQVRGIGSELGWHKGLAAGRFTKAQVGKGEFCLLIAWIGGKFNEGIFENDDGPAIDRVIDSPAFESVPVDVRQAAQRRGTYGGPQACVS